MADVVAFLKHATRNNLVFGGSKKCVCKSGFARAVWPHDCVNFALVYGERKTAQDLGIALNWLGMEFVNSEQFGHGIKCIQALGGLALPA